LDAVASIPRSARAAPRGLLRLRSDAALGERFAAGDELAFAVLYERHRTSVLAVCMGVLGSWPDAEDAAQETFASLAVTLRRSPPRELRPWLVSVARNAAVDAARRRRDKAALGDSGLEPSCAGNGFQTELESVLAGIRQLPEAQRTALLMRELAGNSYLEISKMLEIDEEAVKGLIARARIGLRNYREATEMPCGTVRVALANEPDGRRYGKTVRRHLRGCVPCQAYRHALRGDAKALRALMPGPVGAVAGTGALGGVAAKGALAGGGAIGGGILSGGAMSQIGVVAAASICSVGGVALLYPHTPGRHGQHPARARSHASTTPAGRHAAATGRRGSRAATAASSTHDNFAAGRGTGKGRTVLGPPDRSWPAASSSSGTSESSLRFSLRVTGPSQGAGSGFVTPGSPVVGSPRRGAGGASPAGDHGPSGPGRRPGGSGRGTGADGGPGRGAGSGSGRGADGGRSGRSADGSGGGRAGGGSGRGSSRGGSRAGGGPSAVRDSSGRGASGGRDSSGRGLSGRGVSGGRDSSGRGSSGGRHASGNGDSSAEDRAGPGAGRAHDSADSGHTWHGTDQPSGDAGSASSGDPARPGLPTSSTSGSSGSSGSSGGEGPAGDSGDSGGDHSGGPAQSGSGGSPDGGGGSTGNAITVAAPAAGG
jgi:RNA polymerase sigma factor (sigma-70 family)